MVEICTALRCTVIRLLRTKARPCWALEKRRSGDRLWGTEMVNGNAMMEKRRIQSWTKNSKSGAMQEKQLRRKSEKVPRGLIPVSVGRTDEERKRFLLPVAYLNHPLFQDLLQEASREYGFHHAGILLLPCSIREFENVQITIGFHPRLR
ncbi:hypothetical protein KP509_33G043500 [Ceratopteris richardii]|nr:hypothetical protein KP509_33G043500 [Ceratopteris richardii]